METVNIEVYSMECIRKLLKQFIKKTILFKEKIFMLVYLTNSITCISSYLILFKFVQPDVDDLILFIALYVYSIILSNQIYFFL